MTVLRDLLTPEAAETNAPESVATPRRDMAGAPLEPDARIVDMAGAPFPEPGRGVAAAPAAARLVGSTRGLGPWYVVGLVTLVLVVGGLDMVIRNHNQDKVVPSAAAATAR